MQPGPSKVCPQCGQLVPIDSAHCAFCGHAFRTQFAPPTYSQPQPVYGAYPYPAPKKQSAIKVFIGLLVVACMAAGVYLVYRAKYPDQRNSVGGARGESGAATGRGIVPTSILNQDALTSSYRIAIHWEKSQGGQTMGEVTNNGSQDLPNLYIQFLVKSGSSDAWAGPYQITYQPPGQAVSDAIPPAQSVSFTVPVDFADIERLHAFYLESSPAGQVQYAVAVDQTQDADAVSK